MKRRFTLLLAAFWLLMTSSICLAQTATFTPSTSWDPTGTSGTGSLIEATVDGVTFSCDKGFVTTQIRCYKNGVVTISSENTITQIDFTFSGSYNGGLDASYTGLSTNEWTQTLGSQARFMSIVVTYSNGGGQQTVATPTFSPAAGTYYEAQNVTINSTTTDATIYYTLDGTDPTTSSAVYSSPIAISETTTVKAMGAKAGMNNSSIASATYTIEDAPTPITIAEARALAANEYALVQGIVTFIDGRNVYIQDETAGIDLYLNNNTVPSGLALGDMVLGYGKKTAYNGLIELTGINGGDASQFSIISTGNTLPLAEKTIAEINADGAGSNMLQSTRVKVVDATIGTINTSGNTPLTQGENSINIYKVPALSNISAGDAVDVIAVIGFYNNPQLRVASANDVEIHVAPQYVATPTFSPEAGVYTSAQSVTIACETEDATIYYTLDGTDPTENSTVYSDAIEISENTTIKAYAVKEGMLDSEIASATYNIELPTLTFNKLASHTDVTDNGIYMIVDVAGGYALTSANGSSSAPTAVAVTIENDAISGNIADELQWNFTAVEGGYKINPINSTSTYLYTTSTNNGVRVGDNTNNVWELDITDNANYHGFKNVAFTRYLGVYNNADWRTYTTIHNNIKNTQIEIFVLGDAPVHTYYAVNVATGIANGTVEVSPTTAEAGTTITVTATPATGYELATLTYTVGQSTFNINQETMQFTMPSGDVTVNATFSELEHVATPTFTPAAGSFITAQQVEIACATEGATIYYTTDGTEPTENSAVYAEAFTVSSTTTVKALAVKEGMNDSDIASVTYTIIEPMTIAAARALENNQYALVQGIVTFIDGRNVYVQDDTAGIDLYLNSNTVPSTLALGDMVLGYGKKTVFNGLVELTAINGGNDNQFVIVSTGNPLPVAVKTIAEILADHNGDKMLQSTRVQIVDATIGAINTSNNTPITQGESTLNIYKMPVVEGLEEGDNVSVIGIIGCYNNPQLRVAMANDVTFTHPAGIFINPTSLAGFAYVYEEGPSNVKTFNITGRSLTAATHIYAPENYEMSSFPGDNFYPESHITINTYTGTYNYTIKVRLKAGLEVGTYDENITITQSEVGDMTIALSGSVTGDQPQPQGGYTRLSDLSELTSGSKVVFAARYDDNATSYYAMTAQASGKPTGVLFTSVIDDAETLPAEITDEEETYYWTVDVDGDNYTFTNANGDVLGYTSSTNFATGGDNTAWAITYQTSEATAMVPEYSAFVINNVNNAIRAFALNSNHNFGPYHTQNIAADNYNFFIDIFATAGGGTLTCATPTFTPEAGTYYEAQEVAISCNTADATIYYTLDGSDPTENSAVYSVPIAVEASMTIKAIAMKEGYENSNIATAEYTIILGAVTIFNQDWENGMNDWTFVTVEGGNAWTIATYSNNHYAYANGYNGGVNEQWCISPAFDLYTYTNASLTFRNAKNYTGPDMQLYFSNNYDGENPATATWTELEFNKSTGSYAWTESGTIDLANFTGEECYIGFKYTSTENEAAAWEVDDIVLMGFTTQTYINVTPSALTGFTYIVGNGPSQVQTFTVSGGNLPPAPGGTTGGITITCSNTHYEFSLDGEEFWPYTIGIQATGTLEPTTLYVRLEEGLPVGPWDGVVTFEDGGYEVTATVSGIVTEEPVPGDDWNRIYALSDLHDGDQVIIASRYDATVGDGYYAMPAVVSGKPDGVLFTSVNNGGVETLPAEISGDADTYLWNVTMDGDVITLVNAAGDTLGYSSSTNFAGNVNTEWNIVLETSGEGAMIPNYTGFVITNGTTTNRGIAKNASHKFGAYSTSNLNNSDYNFYMDLFVQGGSVTPTVATPVFSMASGTYYEAIEVEITCATEGATIYYTTDGTDPDENSEIYTEPIMVEESMTIKAIAMMEGYDNSGIASVNYVIMTNIEVILSQDWEGEMNGWTFVTVEGNKPWTIATYGGNKYANANGYGDEVDNEQWCISPAFNLDQYADKNVTLTFRNAMKFTGPALELFFANDYDGQDPTAASWEPLSFIASEGNYVWTESGEISMNTLSGENCNIAFKYTSTIDEGAAAWEVDDILVVANMGDDPYLSATPNALSGFSHMAGQGPSEAQTFVLTGGNLAEGFLTLTVDNGFEISFDGELYTSISITIPVDGGTLEPTTVYVRLNGEEIGDYEGTITIEDEIEITVSLSGTVTSDGIDETLASSVNVWNNINELMIENNGNETLNVVVYNIVGQPVLSETAATGSNTIRHNLAEGVYIVRIANSKEKTSVKVVVRR